MNELQVILTIIDLVFDKHCTIKEVSYQQDALVCDDLFEMKKELKNKIKEIFIMKESK